MTKVVQSPPIIRHFPINCSSQPSKKLNVIISYKQRGVKRGLLAAFTTCLGGLTVLFGLGLAGANIIATIKGAALLAAVISPLWAAQVTLLVFALVACILGICLAEKMGIMAYRYLTKPKEFVDISKSDGLFIDFNNGMSSLIKDNRIASSFKDDVGDDILLKECTFDAKLSQRCLPLNKPLVLILKSGNINDTLVKGIIRKIDNQPAYSYELKVSSISMAKKIP